MNGVDRIFLYKSIQLPNYLNQKIIFKYEFYGYVWIHSTELFPS